MNLTRLLLQIIFVFFIGAFKAQTICSFSTIGHKIETCVYNPVASSYSYNKALNSNVDYILNKVGLHSSSFIVKRCDEIQNALAFNHNGDRYILIDDVYFNSFNANDYTNIFILSHEIGHHLHGHLIPKVITNNDSKNQELQADRFAGYVLGKSGITKKTLNSLLDGIFTDGYSTTHPSKTNRIESCVRGYEDAITEQEGVLSKFYDQLRGQINQSIKANVKLKAINEYENLVNNFSQNQLRITIEEFEKAQVVDNEFKLIELPHLYALNGNFHSAFFKISEIWDRTSDLKANQSISILYWYYGYMSDQKVPEKVIRKLEKVQTESILDPTVLKYFSIWKREQQDYQGCIEVLEEGIKRFFTSQSLSNDNADMQYLKLEYNSDLAVCYMRIQNYKLALERIKEAVYIKKNLLDKKNATNLMNASLDASNQQTLMYNEIVVNFELNNFKEVIELTKTFLIENKELNRSQVGFLNYANGISLYKEKDFENAIFTLKSAISTFDDLKVIYYYLGLAYYNINQVNQACVSFKVSCDMGLSQSCSRLNIICNE